jgi:hypothetical protein
MALVNLATIFGHPELGNAVLALELCPETTDWELFFSDEPAQTKGMRAFNQKNVVLALQANEAYPASPEDN